MIKQIISSLVIAGLSFNFAVAGNDKHQGKIYQARVVNVEPITETLSHRIPRETCWNEQVRYEQPQQSYQSATPAIIGGILGAAIGNGLGKKHHKSNRAIKAVALGALGASIGHEIGKNHYGQQRVNQPAQYRNERRCEVTYESRYEQQVVGYDVTYRYRGETYRTQMDYDPGKKLPVRVNVRPVI